MKSPLTIALLLLILTFGNVATAFDWPQIFGPNRDGKASNEELLGEWPEGGPKKLWTHPVGDGYAGPAVVGNQVIIHHHEKRTSVVESLNAETGKVNWKKTLPGEYRSGMDRDGGSRCVPLIHKDKIYVMDAGANLTCLNLADGKGVWHRELAKDFGAPLGFFGAGSTPIVVDDKLLVNVGADDACVVALNLSDGEAAWTFGNDKASYSSPITFEFANKKVVAFVTRLNLYGLNPADGSLYFEIPFGMRGPTVNGANPVYADGHLFLNSAYNVGGRWVKLSEEGDGIKAEVAWSNNESFASQYSTPIYQDGYLYGTHGREDFQNGSLRCVEAKTGEVKWKHDVPVGHVILAGDKMLVLENRGTLHLVKLDSEKFQSLANHKVFDGLSRPLPALSNGKLYLRSNGPKGELVCLEVGKSK